MLTILPKLPTLQDTYMGRFSPKEEMVKICHSLYFFCDQFFQSTVLEGFCPLQSKNVFVLVLSHLEPELELFEVDDMLIYSTIISQTSKSSSSDLDKLGPKQKHF